MEAKRRQIEAIENGDTADAFRRCREAADAYDAWLEENNVLSIEQELKESNAEVAAAGA